MPTNKHTHCRDYLFTELGPIEDCPRRKCPGTMTMVYARYENNGFVYQEKECTTCGKVIKPQIFYKHIEERKRREKEERQRAYQNRRRRGKGPNRPPKR